MKLREYELQANVDEIFGTFDVYQMHVKCIYPYWNLFLTILHGNLQVLYI